MPLALKDNLDTIEYPTTGGTPGLAGNRPKRNAVIVQAFLDAGAIALGKCSVHELAYGITNNNAGFWPGATILTRAIAFRGHRAAAPA